VTAAIRIGTCSWADEALVKHWYPRGMRSAEERLRYYAERFSTVEVDSTYYRLPEPEMTARWAERTPPGFVFHVKAFGMMTRHPVRLEQLPPDLRELADVDERGRVERPPRELRAEVFQRFREALEPLRSAGKLGGILLQFPSYVVPKPTSYAYLEWAKEALAGEELLVEFRHRDWLTEGERARTLAFLEELGATFVDKATLLRESDFVTLHAPLLPETRHLIDSADLKLMKRTAYLINAARGPLVNEAALVQALKEGWIAGAALDVYEEEPKVHPGLMALSNVVLAPHIASASAETRQKMATLAVDNCLAVLEGKPPLTPVNPEVLKS